MILHHDCYESEAGTFSIPAGNPGSDPLIILHGLFGAGINWRSLARRFSADRRVFTFDLPNHGHSPHADYLDYPSMARDVAQSCAALGIEKAHILGHSMGGKCAMALALDYPELSASLIVADMGPGPSPVSLAPVVAALTALNLKSIQSRGDADHALAPAIPDRRVRTFLLQNLRRDGEGAFRWRINLPLIARDLATVQGPLQAGAKTSILPALFIHGGQSPYLDVPQKELAQRLFPSAAFSAISGAGHWLHADNPDEFFSQVSMFLSARSA